MNFESKIQKLKIQDQCSLTLDIGSWTLDFFKPVNPIYGPNINNNGYRVDGKETKRGKDQVLRDKHQEISRSKPLNP